MLFFHVLVPLTQPKQNGRVLLLSRTPLIMTRKSGRIRYLISDSQRLNEQSPLGGTPYLQPPFVLINLSTCGHGVLFQRGVWGVVLPRATDPRIRIRENVMWPFRFLIVVCLLSLAKPCSADIIFTLTPTARVDLETSVTITYTLSAAANVDTQRVGEFGFRVEAKNLPNWNAHSLGLDNVVLAPDGSTWGRNEHFLNIEGLIASDIVFFETQVVAAAPSAKVIDTTGGMVGSFDLRWRRPASGQYDAGISTAFMSGSYTLERNGIDVFPMLRATGLGVSTVISVVPEPSSTMLLALASGGMFWQHRRRRRNRQP